MWCTTTPPSHTLYAFPDIICSAISFNEVWYTVSYALATTKIQQQLKRRSTCKRATQTHLHLLMLSHTHMRVFLRLKETPPSTSWLFILVLCVVSFISECDMRNVWGGDSRYGRARTWPRDHLAPGTKCPLMPSPLLYSRRARISGFLTRAQGFFFVFNDEKGFEYFVCVCKIIFIRARKRGFRRTVSEPNLVRKCHFILGFARGGWL